jgi:hypothetical protein
MDFGSTSLTTFNTIFQNLKKMRGLRLSPSIECVLDVLASWRLMTWSDAPASYSSAAKIMSSYS